MLRGLGQNTEYKEAVYIRDRLVYLARLADCDTYDLVKKYASPDPAKIPKRVPDIISFVRPTELAEKIRGKELPLVFTPLEERPEWFREPFFSMRLKRFASDADTVVHPKFGIGEVLKPEPGDPAGIIRVRFADVGIKQLSMEWVVTHCRFS